MPKTFDLAAARVSRILRGALASSVLAIAACGDGTTAISSDADADLRASIASVTISPATISATVGDSGAFTAVARDKRGRVLSNAVITWSSSNSAVVTVRPDGFSVANSPGSATIVASAGTKSGSAPVTVVGPPPPMIMVASVTVSPGSVTGAVNDSTQFVATARDTSGAAVLDRSVTWSSTNTSVVVVSASGMGREVGAGSAQVVATVDGVSGHSNITVTGPVIVAPAAVASVSIAPTSVSINTATSTQLSATTRDASGNVLTGRSISWTSSNALVASVSGSGLVTGVVAGTVTITASSEGMSGNASATVTLLPPPPAPSGWPNMPSAYSVVSNQGFDPAVLTGWNLIWNNNGYGSITSNATAPYSASSVFQVMYPVGFAAGSAPATQTYGMGGKRNVYVGMWWKANANWQGHASNVNKLQFLYPDVGGDTYMAVYGPPGGPYELRTVLQFSGADTRDWLRPNVASGNLTMGDWHRIEWLVEYNTSGAANGVIKYWLDGVLVGDYRDVKFPGTGFAEYKLSPTWGGMGGTKTQTDYFWFDHVTISSR